MGEVEVLPPQDLLNNHHRHHRNLHAYNRNNLLSTSAMRSQSIRNANPVSRSFNRRKRSPPKMTPAPPKVKNTTTVPLREKDTNRDANHKNTIKPSSDLVIGQIKILKRGEVLSTSSLSSAKVHVTPGEVKEEDKVGATTGGGLDGLVVLSSTDRLDPEPDVVPKSVRISDFYAGSAFITSPEPSSLPVPVFFKKKEYVLADDDGSNTNYDATSDLIRLLRLDLS